MAWVRMGVEGSLLETERSRRGAGAGAGTTAGAGAGVLAAGGAKDGTMTVGMVQSASSRKKLEGSGLPTTWFRNRPVTLPPVRASAASGDEGGSAQGPRLQSCRRHGGFGGGTLRNN